MTRSPRIPRDPPHLNLTFEEYCAHVATQLKRFAFSHSTAARIHGLPLSQRCQDDHDLHVVRDRADGATIRPGIIGHKVDEGREVVLVNGLPVTGLADLIVAGDAVAYQSSGPPMPLGSPASSRRVGRSCRSGTTT